MSETIFYQQEALEDFKILLKEGNFTKVFFMADENTHDFCLIPLFQELPELPPLEILEIDAGESSKSIDILHQLWLSLSELQADRHSLLVNVGGGVVCDLGGFLASTYMRGITFVNFPTSLLAQVDASVGGKNGINLDHMKNRIGLFSQPERVYIINEFLESLPYRELRSGFAEMLKHALLDGRDYWMKLSAINPENEIPPAELIRYSVDFKKSVVSDDFRESGRRKILNLGHTLGHALEGAALADNQDLLHGEAVAMGLAGELWLSQKYCNLSGEILDEYLRVFRLIFPEIHAFTTVERLLTEVFHDKKKKGDSIRFSLLQDFGKPQFDVEVTTDDIEKALEYVCGL